MITYTSPGFELLLDVLEDETLEMINEKEKEAKSIAYTFIGITAIVGMMWLLLLRRFINERVKIRRLYRLIPY